MKCVTKIKWLGEMAFDAELDDHHFTLDASPQVGGQNRGPRPKGLLLSGLAGCTGMDVVSILKKMKIDNFEFEIDVEAESTEEHPKVYKTIILNYIFKGENLPIAKVKRAVELSETRYCGASAMLGKTSKIISKIIVNGEEK